MKQLGCCKLSHWKEMKVNLIKLKISVNSLLCSLYKPAMKDSGAIIIVINNNCCFPTRKTPLSLCGGERILATEPDKDTIYLHRDR